MSKKFTDPEPLLESAVPQIILMKNTGRFKYLWMKYVNGVDLSHHCANALKGSYSKIINPKVEQLVVKSLDEDFASFIYICGVATPYKWENNFHLAMMPKKHESIGIARNGIEITVHDAIEIPITKLEEYHHPKGNVPAFNTCRNWQFAYQIANYF